MPGPRIVRRARSEQRAMTADTILVAPGSGHQSAPSDGTKSLLIVIAGPTASGKTGLALSLAESLPIEIVNADSRAFYRGMDVGTAKPTEAERTRVPHHLVDILDPPDPMSITHFQQLAEAAIEQIVDRERIPVLVGGTPQYVNALVEGWQVPEVPPNEDRRRELEREAKSIGVEPILDRLRQVDPDAAERTGPNLRRIIRALEVWEATGIPFSEQRTRGPVPFRAIEFELWLPREQLYERIDRRVDTMIENGLVAEVRHLLALGYDPALPAFSSIGYRQLVPAIAEGADLATAIERIKLDTHRLVRHQQTWYRRNPRLIRIDMTQPDPASTVLGHILPELPATGAGNG
jgi:tRNA dimethylallyltransferase